MVAITMCDHMVAISQSFQADVLYLYCEIGSISWTQEGYNVGSIKPFAICDKIEGYQSLLMTK
jgi:hypothetical protein